LNLAENEIATLNGIENCNCLKTLNLSGNKLEGFDCTPNLPGLTELDLSKNPIKDLPEIGKLAKYCNLTNLNLNETPA